MKIKFCFTTNNLYSTIISILQTLGFLALNPIRAIIQQQPRALFSSVNTNSITTPNTNPTLVNELEQQQQKQSDEPDKLYKKLEIELKGIDPAVLKSYSYFATNSAQQLGIEVGKW